MFVFCILLTTGKTPAPAVTVISADPISAHPNMWGLPRNPRNGGITTWAAKEAILLGMCALPSLPSPDTMREAPPSSGSSSKPAKHDSPAALLNSEMRSPTVPSSLARYAGPAPSVRPPQRALREVALNSNGLHRKTFLAGGLRQAPVETHEQPLARELF